MSLTLCQAVGRRLVWRLYELSSHSSERSTSQLQTSLHSVFFLSFDLFSHTWRWKFPCKTGKLLGSPPGGPQPRGTPHIGSGVLSPCSQRAGGPEEGTSPAKELNPAAGPPGPEAKGLAPAPVWKQKCLKQAKAAETRFISRDTAQLMGEHTGRQSKSEWGRNTHWRRVRASWMRSAVLLSLNEGCRWRERCPRRKRYMYTHSWSRMWCSRGGHEIVKQVSTSVCAC